MFIHTIIPGLNIEQEGGLGNNGGLVLLALGGLSGLPSLLQLSLILLIILIIISEEVDLIVILGGGRGGGCGGGDSSSAEAVLQVMRK